MNPLTNIRRMSYHGKVTTGAVRISLCGMVTNLHTLTVASHLGRRITIYVWGGNPITINKTYTYSESRESISSKKFSLIYHTHNLYERYCIDHQCSKHGQHNPNPVILTNLLANMAKTWHKVRASHRNHNRQ